MKNENHIWKVNNSLQILREKNQHFIRVTLVLQLNKRTINQPKTFSFFLFLSKKMEWIVLCKKNRDLFTYMKRNDTCLTCQLNFHITKKASLSVQWTWKYCQLSLDEDLFPIEINWCLTWYELFYIRLRSEYDLESNFSGNVLDEVL